MTSHVPPTPLRAMPVFEDPVWERQVRLGESEEQHKLFRAYLHTRSHSRTARVCNVPPDYERQVAVSWFWDERSIAFDQARSKSIEVIVREGIGEALKIQAQLVSKMLESIFVEYGKKIDMIHRTPAEVMTVREIVAIQRACTLSLALMQKLDSLGLSANLAPELKQQIADVSRLTEQEVEQWVALRTKATTTAQTPRS